MLELNSPTVSRRFTGKTDPGIVRSSNQDSYYIDPSGRFFIVADGMGGHAGGQEASAIATKLISHYLEQEWESETPSPQLLQKALLEANQGILKDQVAHPERGDMGTTAVMIAFRHDGAWRAHIGDSRLYCLRSSELQQVTEDHTWIARALKMGDIDQEQARIHPWRHVLFQCLGRRDLNQVEVAALKVDSGDLFLLCSDGLTEEVEDEIIYEILHSDKTYEEMANELINTAKAAGGSDNITVVLVGQD
ncbi:MAG: Stp1/IreP family PP2C-type Ser/Thr phosphatase [Snowella sp.]|nr:Stp1/IreP family PP2C-type Ser/Thr phosphatase [Snowella sp.]